VITILFHMTIKPGRVVECLEVARQLTKTTHSEDDGCVSYTFLQQASDSRRFVLFEQWRERDALDAHVRRLVRMYGPPREGEALPATLMEMFEHSEGIAYEPIV